MIWSTKSFTSYESMNDRNRKSGRKQHQNPHQETSSNRRVNSNRPSAQGGEVLCPGGISHVFAPL